MRRLARQALITLLMALALADAALIGSFGPVDPLDHGQVPHVIDRPHGGLYARSASAAPRPAGPPHEYLKLLYIHGSQTPGGPPRCNHTVNRAHNHSQLKGLTR